MKKFVLLNQDEEPICEIEYGKFNFAFAVTKPNQEGFAMPQATEPVTALEILDLLV